MDALADLGAGADEGVGIDEGVLIDVGAGVDVGGRDDDDAGSEISAGADGAAAGDDADVLLGGEAAGGVGVLVEAVEDAVFDGLEVAETEAEEDAALDPGVYAPAG